MVSEQVCLQQPFELSKRVLHCHNLEGDEFYRRGPSLQNRSLMVLCEYRTTRITVLVERSRCMRTSTMSWHSYARYICALSDRHWKIRTARGHRPWIGLVVAWATNAVVTESVWYDHGTAHFRHVNSQLPHFENLQLQLTQCWHVHQLAQECVGSVHSWMLSNQLSLSVVIPQSLPVNV